MITNRVKHHTFKGPNPVSSTSTNNKRYTSLTGLFKSDSCTSLHDIVIPKHGYKPKKPQKSKIRQTTVIPLLGRDGSTAALIPEDGRSSTAKDSAKGYGAQEFKPLRFPLLSPTRHETVLFLRMKTMQTAQRLAGPCLTDGFEIPPNTFGPLKMHPESPLGPMTNPSTRDNTRGRTSVELTTVPPTRERQMHLEKMGFTEAATTKPALQKSAKKNGRRRQKIVIASKYGYHSRSNSATYKRLNNARTRMDNMLETQVIEVTSKSDLPDIEQMDEVSEEIIDSTETISIREKLPPLPFHLDTSIYKTFKECHDLGVLYKKAAKSGKSNKSTRSSARSVTVYLPKVEREVTTLSSIPTDRTDRARPTTPYDQYVNKDQTTIPINSHTTQNVEYETVDVGDRPSTSEGKVPLSLEALTNSEFRKNSNQNSTVLPDIRRAITFNTCHPSSPKKRSRREKRVRPKTNEDPSQVAFLLDDSKSLTPSPTKSKRPYNQRHTPLGTIHSLVTSSVPWNSSHGNDAKNGLSQNAGSDQQIHRGRHQYEKHGPRSSSKLSQQLQNYSNTLSIDSVAKAETSLSQLNTPPVGAHAKVATPVRQIISPPILHDTDEEYYDEFENI